MKKRIVSMYAGGGGSAEPAAERHPQSDPCKKLNVILNRERSERDSGSVPRYEQVSNIGQTLKRVQGDKFLSLRVGFTMAEILLSLTIIGVVAAITLPSLTGNINERTWNTQRKALYARFSQAIALMPALNGYGTLRENTDSAGSTSIEDTAAETFITTGLSKVLKINNICDNEHLSDCGLPEKITNLDGSLVFSTFPKTLFDLNGLFSANTYGAGYSYSQLNTKTAAFETQNGESIAVFYNPTCAADTEFTVTSALVWYHTQPKMCANFVYDLNGSKGPNTVGKDMGFITVLYSSDSKVVAPMPLHKDASASISQTEALAACKEQDNESRIPNKEEVISMFYNQNLIGISEGVYWSGAVLSGQYAWVQSFNIGRISQERRSVKNRLRCIKR